MLSDAICTTPQCDAGAASVSAMDSAFQTAPDNVKAQFQSAHDSIMASFNASYSWYSDLVPFNPNCCTIQAIGQQADTLTAQIQTAQGQTPASPLSVPGMSLQNMLILAGVGYLAFVYLASHR